jgi:hypothetical protein
LPFALIVGVLVLNGITVATNVFEQRTARRIVREWVAPFPDHAVVDVRAVDDDVAVVRAGPITDERPTADQLADLLSVELGREISVDLRIRLETQDGSA